MHVTMFHINNSVLHKIILYFRKLFKLTSQLISYSNGSDFCNTLCILNDIFKGHI